MDAVRASRSSRETLGLTIMGAAGVVVLITVGVLLRDAVPGVDSWVQGNLRVGPGLAESWLAGVSDGIRALSVAAAAAAIGWLCWHGRRRALVPAVGYAALFLLLTPSSELLKEWFGRAHPSDPADVSYPSTHVAMVTVALAILAAIVAAASRRPPTLLVGVVAAGVVATAATRVLLGEHYLTDVVGTAVGYAGASLLGVLLLWARTREVWLAEDSAGRRLPRQARGSS